MINILLGCVSTNLLRLTHAPYKVEMQTMKNVSLCKALFTKH